jgi:hypothetical protein
VLILAGNAVVSSSDLVLGSLCTHVVDLCSSRITMPIPFSGYGRENPGLNVDVDLDVLMASPEYRQSRRDFRLHFLAAFLSGFEGRWVEEGQVVEGLQDFITADVVGKSRQKSSFGTPEGGTR